MIEIEEIITGEKIQQFAKNYLGLKSDFEFNPIIYKEKNKCIDLNSINSHIENQDLLFCYSHRLLLLQSKIHFFINNFILITHNSDENISEKYFELLNSKKIIKWFCQNKMVEHYKLELIPIGIANSMWEHGNLNHLINNLNDLNLNKINDFYFNFNIQTNKNEREYCKNELIKKGLKFIRNTDYLNYLKLLKTHKFAICPPGNGVDCHRIWECYYLFVIPIVKRSIFTENLSKIFPCIIIDDWSLFDSEMIILEYPKLIDELKLKYYKLYLSYIHTIINKK